MERIIYKYTPYNNRTLIYEGTFIVGDDVEINVGDEILVFHKCNTCGINILQVVEKKIIAYYFNDVPVYDYHVINGGSYKCNIKHISIYDQLLGECLMK
jgi:hypothetical protein